MPFRLVNAPATFQRLMEVVLAGVTQDGCHVYLDHVLVFGKTIEDHNQNLRRVLARIEEAGLKLKPKKCRFVQTSVEYLMHVVSEDGVQTDPKKVDAVRQYPTPTEVRTLRSFLGLASYYRKFLWLAHSMHLLRRRLNSSGAQNVRRRFRTSDCSTGFAVS